MKKHEKRFEAAIDQYCEASHDLEMAKKKFEKADKELDAAHEEYDKGEMK